MVKTVGDTKDYQVEGRSRRFTRVVDTGDSVRIKEFRGVRHAVLGNEITVPKECLKDLVELLKDAQ